MCFGYDFFGGDMTQKAQKSENKFTLNASVQLRKVKQN